MKKKKFPALNELKVRLKDSNITYRELSEKTGITVGALNDKINGHSAFDPDEVMSVASAVNISPNDFTKCFFPKFYKEFYENVS